MNYENSDDKQKQWASDKKSCLEEGNFRATVGSRDKESTFG